MIKIEKSNKSQSYWRHDGLYDNKHEKVIQVKILGVTLWRKIEKLDCDLQGELNKNGVGFKG